MLEEELNRRNQNLKYRIEMDSSLLFFEFYRQRFSVSKKNSEKSKILLANCQLKKQRINFFLMRKITFVHHHILFFYLLLSFDESVLTFYFDLISDMQNILYHLISSYIVRQCIIKLYAYICIYVYIYHRFIA